MLEKDNGDISDKYAKMEDTIKTLEDLLKDTKRDKTSLYELQLSYSERIKELEKENIRLVDVSNTMTEQRNIAEKQNESLRKENEELQNKRVKKEYYDTEEEYTKENIKF